MSTTITVRTDAALRDALEKRARELGKPLSVLVREILARSLEEVPMGSRAAPFRGKLNLDRSSEESWRRQLADRNWRR